MLFRIHSPSAGNLLAAPQVSTFKGETLEESPVPSLVPGLFHLLDIFSHGRHETIWPVNDASKAYVYPIPSCGNRK